MHQVVMIRTFGYVDATSEPITSGDLFDTYAAGGFTSNADGYTEVGK